MSANGISTLIAGDGSDPVANKAARQIAKLDMAQTSRQAGGDIDARSYRIMNIYDINTIAGYGVDPEDRILGVRTRPWIDTA